uniref:Monodehydroascorbate reductase n=1 Tax=Tanacetum cinerariifolium TaxID=118510 RepID=A0A6L2JRX4_TANCI|nr:hypothetical protein [Tanacetum cinerariifolium]
MDITRAEQITLDDALVAPTNPLKIGKTNLRLSSDLKSKEATLQVVYDVLKLTPFYKAFQITSDVPEIYMQKFWATATVHHHSIRFKINNKKHIVNLEDLGHNGEIKKNVDYAYLLWEDFVYQVENKNAKKGNEMYYPRFTKVIINFFMTKDQSIPRKNKINWHFARDDQMFTTIKVVSRHDDTQLYGAILPDELTNKAIKDFESYKEYYAIASGAEPSKTKASKSSEKEDDDEVGMSDDDDDDDADNQEYDGQDDESQDDDNEQTDSDNDGDDFVHPKFSTLDQDKRQDEEDSFDHRVQTPSRFETTDDEEIQDVNVKGDELDEEEINKEDKGDELYRDMNINLEGRDIEMTDAHPDTCIDSIFNLNTELTSLVDVSVTTIAEPPLLLATTLPPPPIPLITHLQQTPIPTLATVLRSSSLRDEAQAENKDFINKLDDNIKKITKDQVKEQVKAQVSKIFPKIEKTINEQLEAEVLTRLSNKSKTSHTVATNLSELELKKILIDKMESNKSIYKSDEQNNLYKELVEAYESDKLILDTYGDTMTLKRCQDDEDKDEEPFAGLNRESKRRRARKEPESTSAPKEKTSKTNGKSTEGSKSHHKSAGEFAQAEEPMHTAKDLEEPTLPDAHGPVQPWLSSLAQMEDPRESFNELLDTPLDFTAFSLVELKYFLEEVYKVIIDQLDWNNSEGQQYPHDLRKPLPWHIKWIEDLVPNTMWSQVPVSYDKESAHDVYSKRRIIIVTKLQIFEWHNYKHLDWITVRRDDDKLYTFKEGDFNRLRIQDIEDMLLFLV